MYEGTTLQNLATEVERKAQLKDDLVVDTRHLKMWGGRHLKVEGGDDYEIAKIAHDQIAGRLAIPRRYYDRLLDHSNPMLKGLLDTSVNTLFQEEPERRMLRTYQADGDDPSTMRAFLSDRYRRRDNDDLLGWLMPIMAGIPDLEVKSCALTDTRFFLKAVTPRVTDEVAVGDEVQAGFMIRNSEVGHGLLEVAPLVFRLICLNGMVVAESKRSRHVGRRVDEDEDRRVFSDVTLQLDDEAFFSALGDVVRAAVDEARFLGIVQQLRDSKDGEKVVNPPEAIEHLANRFSLGDGEKGAILRHLTEGGDLSTYGVLNAVTAAADDASDYEGATDLERVGGEILALPKAEWHAIATA